MNLTNFVIGGVPIILIVFALVEEIKSWGLSGKVLRAVALALGLVAAVSYQFAFLGPPVTPDQWYTIVAVGIMYGLTASGAYNFLDARFPAQ